MPKGNPPKNLTTKVLIKGTGPVVAPGDTVVVQYVGAIWRNGSVFDSSWKRSQPFGFTIAASPSQVIPGWDKGLVGPDRGQPGDAGDTARGRLRQDRQPAGAHQGDRHPGLRGGHPGRLRRRK